MGKAGDGGGRGEALTRSLVRSAPGVPSTTAVPLLIVGAGPFGLAVAAYARRQGIEHLVVGEPMGFWKTHMPAGMRLRSGPDWHYDPFDEDTLEVYLRTHPGEPGGDDPLTLKRYLGYAEWFQRRKGIDVRPAHLVRLDHGGARPGFTATLDDGGTMAAQQVVLALGFRHFAHVPAPYPELFPSDRLAHTCDLVDFSALAGRRVLIVGGRQSAFEWAALVRERGADAVYLSYRHATPSFAVSDWSWVKPLVDGIERDPGWFRRLTAAERDEVSRRLWAEGRLKLEPWLASRIAHERIRLFPHTHPTGCREHSGSGLTVTLNDGTALPVDQVVMATGYKVDVSRVPMLAAGNILGTLATSDGCPVLDEHFQTSVPGLFFTSMCAARDFGPFFAFTVSVRASAKLIGAALRADRAATPEPLRPR